MPKAGFAKSYFIYLQETGPDTGTCIHECPVVDLSWSFYFHFYFIDLPEMDYQEYLSSVRIVFISISTLLILQKLIIRNI